jgi:hypothetical protein
MLGHPRLVAGPAGGMTLAYLVRREFQQKWSLRACPVVLDRSNGGLKVLAGGTKSLADGVLLSPPAFSADGRWVFTAVADEDGPRVIRVANPFYGPPCSPSVVEDEVAVRAPDRAVRPRL